MPALLILKQPDLGSSLVFGPVLLAMCYAAGASARSILLLLLIACGVMVFAYFEVMHEYQRGRVVRRCSSWSGSGSGSLFGNIMSGAGMTMHQCQHVHGGAGVGARVVSVLVLVPASVPVLVDE